MAIPVKFQQFKSAGIYRLVYDNSIIQGTSAALLRLLVGYSNKGPFNTPVYISTTSEFKSIFGEGSKSLEKRGCFFHRMALQMLSAGPILCLNLKPFTTESVGVFGIQDKLYPESKLVTDIYDRTRFWKLDETKLNDGNHYMHIGMTDSKDTSASFFIRKAPLSKVKEYDITVADWYNNYGEDIPEYLIGHESSKISDFFTEIYLFKGEFTVEQVRASSTLKKYFKIAETYQPNVNCWQVIEEEYAGKWFINVKDNLNGTYSYIPRSVQVVPVFTTDINDEGGTEYLYHANEVTMIEDKYYVTNTLVEGAVGDDTVEVKIREFMDPIDKQVYDKGTDTTIVDNKYYLTETLEDGKVINGSIEVKLGDYVVDYDSYDDSFNISFDGSDDAYLSNVIVYNTIKNAFGDDVDALDALANDSSVNNIGHYIGCLIPNFIDNNYGYKSIDILFNNDSDTHHMMMSLDEDMLYNANYNFDDIFTEANIALKPQYDEENPENITASLQPCFISGYTYKNEKPASSSFADKYEWQKSLLNVLATEKGLLKGLLSPAEIDYRYIVDSFESYYNATDEMKSELSALAKQKELCFSILNFPSVSNLMKQAPDIFGKSGVFDINTVPKNINLPSEINGASFCAFFTPLKFSDGYVDTIVPSAALVSNLFMQKYNGRFPYSIIAGPNYANIQYANLVGPDYHYSQDELHVIEPFGINCMVYRPTFGTFINANQTAKQVPKSALSAINVRELVIYLQDEIGKILQANQWEFNNATTRNEIKTKADIICEATKSNGGIIEYYNQMDDLNNTAELIDNEFAVLSTYIEPGRGMGKMVHELTIYNTGQMSSSITLE